MPIARRQLLRASAGAAAVSRGQAATQQPPNIVLVLADDHGYGDLGCQGATDVSTPNIDAMAADGVRFTNWYAAAPVCAPSRGALMTGRYPQRNGVTGNGKDLPVSEITIAQLLKQRGYATGICGKWNLGTHYETDPNSRGFDYFYGFHTCIDHFSHRFYWGEPRIVNYHDLWRNRTEIFEDGQYFTELVRREALEFIHRNHGRPFFLYLPFNTVHYPMHAPQKYVARFPNLPRERQIYAAMLASLDDGVGEVRAALRRYGIWENTMMIFTSDNGATAERRAGLNQQPARAGHNGPFRGWKFSAFDGGMHVSAVMSWPGHIPAGRVSKELVTHMDILPTVCKMASVDVPSDRVIDGRDIMPVAAAGASSPHDVMFWEFHGQTAVLRGNWKLVHNGFEANGYDDLKPLQGDDSVFLSNLAEDPGEKKNLRHVHPQVADELLTLIAQWQREVQR